MRLWCHCAFCVIGRPTRSSDFALGCQGLEQALDDGPLWHHAKITVRDPGFLCVAASRNYGGANHAEQMVYEFPFMRERRCGITM